MDYFDYNEFTEGGIDEFQPDDFDIEEFLEQSQEQHQKRLEQELERIEEQLEEREEVHREAIDELETKLDWYIERLETLYKRESGTTEEHNHLKQKIEEFYHEIQRENKQIWNDKQSLERERRELLLELDEIEDDELLSEFL